MNAAICAKGYEGGSGALEGLRFGALIGIFIVFAVVADEYVTLNIGARLATFMALGRFIGWLVTGLAIGPSISQSHLVRPAKLCFCLTKRPIRSTASLSFFHINEIRGLQRKEKIASRTWLGGTAFGDLPVKKTYWDAVFFGVFFPRAYSDSRFAPRW